MGHISGKRTGRSAGHAFFAAALFCIVILGRGAAAAPLEVLVSLPPQRFFVDRLGGSFVKVTALIPRSANAHTYEPTIEQFVNVSRARAYFKVGHPLLPFEKQWEERARREKSDLLVIDCCAGIGGDDPHLWLSISHARRVGENIARGLQDILPNERVTIQANLENFLRELDALEDEMGELMKPEKRKQFFVFHPAWGYLASEFGLEQVAIERDGKEPDPSVLMGIVRQLRELKAPVIFVEPQLSRTSAELIAREVQARVDVLDPLAENWIENMRMTAAKIGRALRE